MRVKRIAISGFRAFATPVSLDLDADVVIVTGENGQGKTSLFDAIHWALVGRLSRLADNHSSVVSVYSPSGEARVELELGDQEGQRLRIIRSSDDGEGRFAVETGAERYQGQKAQLELLDRIWPSALSAADVSVSFEAAITRSVYLQQDRVRQFIEADSEQDRFNAVSELMGTGRITDLHVNLERSKKAWSGVTNQRRDDMFLLSSKLELLRAQLADLTSPTDVSIEGVESLWQTWWFSLRERGIDVAPPPSPTSPDASSTLDLAIRQLDANRRAVSRRGETIAALLEETASWEAVEDVQAGMAAGDIQRVSDQIRTKEGSLQTAREDLDRERDRLRKAREAHEELRTLAQIALRHLGDRCPVCTQEYDDEVARRHLSELLQAAPEAEGSGPFEARVASLESELLSLEDEKRKLENQLSRIERLEQEKRERAEAIDERLGELGIRRMKDKSLTDTLRGAVEAARIDGDGIRDLQDGGETLASELAKIASVARAREIRNEVEELEKQHQIASGYVREREETGELAGKILDAVRESASSIVQSQLREIDPLLQRIYSRIDPHRTFRTLTLLSSYSYGRGHLKAQVADPSVGFKSGSPETILSSSQMNALAVSIFLAFNLGMPSIPLGLAILDDPFQSLDDINLLGLVDLLRRFATKRQLLISTHDSRFADLLRRKLRPLSEARRSIVLELQGWSREGPAISWTAVPVDRVPMKIAA